MNRNQTKQAILSVIAEYANVPYANFMDGGFRGELPGQCD